MQRAGKRVLWGGVGLVIATLIVSAVAIVRRGDTHPTPTNVLIISLDTTRADYLGCYDDRRRITPNLDAFAQQSVLFERVTAPVPMTLPSHSTMMTGLDPPVHGAHDNLIYKLSESTDTLAEVLRDEGLMTGAFVSTYVLDSLFNLDQGFATYDDHLGGEPRNPNNARRGDKTVDRAIQWMRMNAHRPFFLFVHLYDPHFPYEAPAPFGAQFSDPYAGEIAFTDHVVGLILKELTQLGLDESTLVLIVADHGEMLGEHGEKTHSYFVYEPVTAVPMMIRTPGGLAGRRIDTRVGVVDVAPTISGALGLDALTDTNGEDLSPFLFESDVKTQPRAFYIESVTPRVYSAGPLIGLVEDNWKYIHGPRPELYNLAADPNENSNLAAAQPQLAARFANELRTRLNEYGPQTITSYTPGDDESAGRLKALGYTGSGTSIVVTTNLFPEATTHDAAVDLIEFHERALEAASLMEDGDLDAAERAFKQLLSDRKTYYDGYAQLANIAGRRGDFKLMAEYVSTALEAFPDKSQLLVSMAAALAIQGQYERAIEHYKTALAIDDQFADRFTIHFDLGGAYRATGELEKAVDSCYLAYRSQPDQPKLYENSAITMLAEGGPTGRAWRAADALDDGAFAPSAYARGMWYLKEDDPMRALKQFRIALDDQREVAAVHFQLGTVLMRLNDEAAGVDHFIRAAELDPESSEALNNAAWFTATGASANTAKRQQALAFAQRACQLRPNDPACLDTLAAAQAANEQFTEAQRTLERAIELAARKSDTGLVQELRQHLEFYRRGEPFLRPTSRSGTQP